MWLAKTVDGWSRNLDLDVALSTTFSTASRQSTDLSALKEQRPPVEQRGCLGGVSTKRAASSEVDVITDAVTIEELSTEKTLTDAFQIYDPPSPIP